jgi:hypothetical protein
MKTLRFTKNSTLAALIAGFAIAVCGNGARAQNAPIPAPPLPATPGQKPINEQATDEAWAAFHSGDNATAIARADECISRFGDAADRIESILETNAVSLPNGHVTTAEKKRIARYQILHDVATCYLIKGWAEEKLGHIEQAKNAYSGAQKYTQARTTSPNEESFWSPADAASERLTKLPKTSSQ